MSDVLADVSRETTERLETFCHVLKKWNPRINLVSKSSLDDLWNRHILDSIQVSQAMTNFEHWVDIGSGGGFPGLVVAILAAEGGNSRRVTLVESDQRKAAFLRTAARDCGVSVEVLAERIEAVDPFGADVLSARALADLTTLLSYTDRHLAQGGTALFPKGVSWQKEVEDARREWSFDLDPITSKTEAGAAILKIRSISRV